MGLFLIERLPIDPHFVDLTAELAALDEVLRLLPRGIRRHTALLGLRRIGKAFSEGSQSFERKSADVRLRFLASRARNDRLR